MLFVQALGREAEKLINREPRYKRKDCEELKKESALIRILALMAKACIWIIIEENYLSRVMTPLLPPMKHLLAMPIKRPCSTTPVMLFISLARSSMLCRGLK